MLGPIFLISNVKRLTLMLLAVTACVGSVALAAAVAKPAETIEDLTFAALEKRQTLSALRKQVKVDRAKWPKGDLSGLDLTKATGNAIIVHTESGRLKDPTTMLTGAVPFKLFHLEDDPYRLVIAARGIGLAKGEDKAKYHTAQYRPTLELMVRAKYVLFVVGELDEPRISALDKSFTGGKLEGAGMLYEIESKKLLGGFAIEAKNSTKVTTRTGGYTGQALDAVMHDFENNARAALWKGLKTRFPTAKIPTIVYLNSNE